MPIDPLTERALTAAAKFALGKLAALLPSNARAVDDAYAALLQEMVLEVVGAFRAHLAHHEAKDPGFAERVAAALDEREARALFYRLGTEAAQATTPERMRMLAHALAGLYAPDLDAETRSRVSRAVLALEPSDIVTLRNASETEPRKGSAAIGGEPILSFPPDRKYQALIVAGCMADANVVGGGVYLTDVGRGVLKAVELWK